MIIAHFKNTPIANAPEAVSDVINKYTEHYSYVLGYSYPNGKIISNTTIIHQHNKNNFDSKYKNKFKNKVIQYHSEPFRVDLDVTIPKLVIAQYHATLPEYRNCTIVRNPIDLYDIKYFPKYNNKKIRIGYSPSTIMPETIWADKGYNETIPVLKNLKERYGNLIDIDIIVNEPLDVCLERKSLCNIFIDEVKTPSYHRSGLEALGMGIPTICSIGSSVEKVLLETSKAPNNPFINVNYFELESKLIELIELGVDNLMEIGYNNRVWMEKYWHPKTIADEYISIYEKNN